MFEHLKSALGIETATEESAKSETLTRQMLQDLNLPELGAAGDTAEDAVRCSPEEEAAEVVSDWSDEGIDLEQPLPIVFEALFDSEKSAQSYLLSVTALGIAGVSGKQTRPFVDSFAATVTVAMIPEPAEIARIAEALKPAADAAGGKADGYYLEGRSEG